MTQQYERRGVWCGRTANCQPTATEPRQTKSNESRNVTQTDNGDNGYDHLSEPYLTYYHIAMRFAPKAKTGEKDDLLHTIIEALAGVALRKIGKGEAFSEAAMYRTAEHVKDAYWYRYYSYHNGLDCRHCTTEQRARCRWNWAHSDWQYCDCHRAIQLASINQPVTDDEGNLTELADLIADDRALDLDAWVDARTFLIGAPIRLKVIAKKRAKGEKLTQPEHNYLNRLRQRYQKILV